MNINNLIIKIKEKLNQEIKFEELNIEDKTFLHKNHQSHEIGKFHPVWQSPEYLQIQEESRGALDLRHG